MSDGLRAAFEAIYAENRWVYGSGVGSLPVNTTRYRAFLESFLAMNAIRTVTDFGCGDWQSSRLIDWSNIEYVGFDVVSHLSIAMRLPSAVRAWNSGCSETSPSCLEVISSLPRRCFSTSRIN